ncbi:Ig-like domain-containing protein [Paeniglutamicibacter terrestris]|uniref:Gram-positive cocci surface proteins LPxTG domain-containing protein n=1 Tax=Paeniglutamicibacter terrestris TaxID=2723403 RepID=A0ABX1G9Y4_9MICC|nr:Ig-like domain-containing protein [Paeniglutamicibacter terrestris]NKG22340.1 hypothetical protein [Paeniglutamicibacter terrestris]
MHDSSRALLKRGSIAAATALVIGSSFMAAPAIATATATPEPTSSESAAVPSPESSTAPDVATLPEGLEEAVERDLGISIEEFYENGELNEVVETLSKELKQAKLVADFAIADKKINVTVAASSLKAVTEKLDELTKDTGVEVDIVAEEEAETKVDTSSAPVADASGEAKASIAPEATAPSTAEAKASSTPKSKDLKVAESPKIKAEVAPEVQAKANPKNVDALLDAYVAAVEPEAVSQLQAIMKSSDGTFVIRTGGVAETEKKKTSDSPKASSLRFSDKLTAEEFAEQYTKVTVEVADGPAKTAASTDVLGGMGYGAPNANGYSVCSIGFTGYNGGGDEAAISAGHCEHDGDITDVQILEHSAPNEFSGPGAALGTFGFSQFGGPNNSSVTGLDDAQSVDDLGNVGTDISVIDQINPALTLKALVSDWTTADVRDHGTKVTGVAAAVAGTDICKSGRTTGWTCGTVDEVGIFLVGGYNGADDARGVRGFGMPNVDYAKANEGDSGGSVISGGTAVGVTSAIAPAEGGRAYFTDIVDALDHTDNYSIAMFLNAPVVKAPAQGSDVAAGSTITGTVAGAPTGSTVKVMSGGKAVATAKVASGAFSFKVPANYGKFDFTLQTIKGFNESEITAGSVNVVIGAPVISTPKNAATLNTPVSTVSGTGVVGATVTLAGDATGTAVVDADGKWSIKLPTALSYGEHTISATQAKGGETSKAATSSFTVQLVSPAITAPADGKTYTSARSQISGTGVAGATVKLTGSVTQDVVVAADGTWTIKLTEILGYGSHSITAVQTSGENTSASVKSDFKVVPAAPSIDSPADGQDFAFDKAPTSISGFGINGATVKVTIGDVELTAEVANGAWTVMVPSDLGEGDHKVTAVQVIDEATSAAVSITFNVAAEPKPEPTEEPTTSPEPTEEPTTSPEPSEEPTTSPEPSEQPTTSPEPSEQPTTSPEPTQEPTKAPVEPQGNTNNNGDKDPLANTGPNVALPFIATGGALLVAAGAFLLFRRKGSHGA